MEWWPALIVGFIGRLCHNSRFSISRVIAGLVLIVSSMNALISTSTFRLRVPLRPLNTLSSGSSCFIALDTMFLAVDQLMPKTSATLHDEIFFTSMCSDQSKFVSNGDFGSTHHLAVSLLNAVIAWQFLAFGALRFDVANRWRAE